MDEQNSQNLPPSNSPAPNSAPDFDASRPEPELNNPQSSLTSPAAPLQPTPPNIEPSSQPIEQPVFPTSGAVAPNSNQPPLPAPENQGMSLHAARFGKSMPDMSGVVPPNPGAPIEAPHPLGHPVPEPYVPGHVERAAAEADEADEVASFSRPHDPAWKTGVKAAFVFVATFVVVFGILEAPALYSRAKYYVTHFGDKAETADIAFLPKLQDRPLSLTDLKNDPGAFGPTESSFGGYTLADIGDDQLLIPKIDVRAPIVWGSAPDETSMLASLQKGIAHYNFTATPDQGAGKVFLSGHSSYNLWDSGQYKTVFANLDRLDVGDQIALTYKGLVYIYQVETKVVVKPTQVEVLDQTNEPTLSLMTCVPVGTSLNRLVVTSKLVSAAPTTPIQVPPGITDPASIFYYLPAY